MTGIRLVAASMALALALGFVSIPPSPATATTVAALASTPTEAATAFVDAVHLDLLGRYPTDGERAASAASPLGTSAGRARVVTDIVHSGEWAARTVGDRYTVLLGRSADPGGLAFWSARLVAGEATIGQMEAALASSQERFAGAAGSDLRTWVQGLYATILGRDGSGDPAGVDYWTHRAGLDGRRVVAEALIRSAESCRRQVELAFVELLGRPADAAGLVYWSAKLAERGVRALDVGLVSSAEYFDRAPERVVELTAVPGPPVDVEVEPHTGEVTVSWAPPAAASAGPVVGYEVHDADGAHGCMTTTATTCTVTGLDRGRAYRFTVTARNAWGDGPPSAPSRSVVPDLPVPGVGADSYAGVVRVWWDMTAAWFPGPENPDAFRITVRQGATVVHTQDIDLLAAWKGDGHPKPPGTIPFPADWGDIVSGLTDGVAYTFTVTVLYASDPGTESPPTDPVVATPAILPPPPTRLEATPGDGSASLIWATSWATDQAPLIGFRVVTMVDGVEVARRYFDLLDIDDPYSPLIVRVSIDGLTNGTTYQFVVNSVTTAGDSGPSDPSNAVTPTASP